MAITVYTPTGLIGGTSTDLDGQDGNTLLDGDLAFTYDSATNLFYIHELDATSGLAANPPNIIIPVTNPGNKRWILQGIKAEGLETISGVTIGGGVSVAGSSIFNEAVVIDNLSVTSGTTLSSLNLTSGVSSTSGATFTSVSAGALTVTDQPRFLVVPATNQENIAAATLTTVVWGTETVDVGEDFASNTFTAPADGTLVGALSLYLLNIDSAATSVQVRVVSSNKIYTYAWSVNQFAGDLAYWPITIPVCVPMDAADTCYIDFYITGGAAQTDISTDSYWSGLFHQH